uniref:Uncharacterized protein n=1 Tax=Noccaea caerulescens TaxID=107243 RepID=A0A1J3EQM5_NOCCA
MVYHTCKVSLCISKFHHLLNYLLIFSGISQTISRGSLTEFKLFYTKIFASMSLLPYEGINCKMWKPEPNTDVFRIFGLKADYFVQFLGLVSVLYNMYVLLLFGLEIGNWGVLVFWKIKGYLELTMATMDVLATLT